VIDSSYIEGRVELDPRRVLNQEKMVAVQMVHYEQRGYIELATERFKIQTLLDRNELNIKNDQYIRKVIRLWIRHYGDCMWRQFKNFEVPDAPRNFWKVWEGKNDEANRYLGEYFEAIKALDETVANWYNVPADLRPLLQERLPWTHGAD